MAVNGYNLLKMLNIPFLEFFHMQEPVAVLSGQFKLGRQREH